MRIKAIEITGFKSFAEKTRINFPDGVAAVVGPNGCGKSNIVDSLRWVMGEQRAKELRGKSMDDIIFAGTEGQQPLNMAEVSLTLVTDKDTTPDNLKDYTELQITRRIFRSGETAYLINKQPCRLKDIQNVFFGSGMGKKSYAVIQQGNIGAITDATPEERRFFIEDAAGVTKYKTRKTETVNKIKSTRENLSRVDDIISEVSRQMEETRRQAKTAEKFKNLQNRIRRLDIFIAVRTHNELERKHTQASRHLESLKNDDIRQNTLLRQIDAAISEFKLNRQRRQDKIERAKNRQFAVQREIDTCENDLKHLREETIRLKSETETLEGTQTSALRNIEEMKSEIDEAEKTIDGLKSQAEEMRGKIASESEASTSLKKKQSERKKALEALNASYTDIIAGQAKIKSMLQNMSQNRESLGRRLKRIDEDTAIAEKSVAGLEQKEAAAQKAIEELADELTDMEEEISLLKNNIDDKKKNLAEAVRKTRETEIEKSRKKSEFATLKKMEDNLDGFRDGVKAVVKWHRDENGNAADDETFHLIADIITPDPGYETAVETALGDALQYIVVRDQESSRKYLEYLYTNDAGRSSFIPSANLKPLAVFPAEISGPARPLSNHIQVANGSTEAVKSLLSHVAVTDTIEEAIAFWNNTETAVTAVTKDGWIISRRGIITGGSRDTSAGLLTQKKELRDLETDLSRLSDLLLQSKKNQETLENQLRDLESDLQKSIQDRHQVLDEKAEAEKNHYRISESLKHEKRQLHVLRLEQEQLSGEEADIDGEIETLSRRISETENSLKTVRDEIENQKTQINSDAVQLETLDNRSVDRKLELTALTAKIDGNMSSLRRLADFREQSLRQYENSKRDLGIKTERAATAAQEIKRFESRLVTLYDEIKQLYGELEAYEAENRKIHDSITEKDTDLSRIKNEREATLARIHSLEIEASQLEVRKQNIESRIYDTYHHPIAKFRTAFENEVKTDDDDLNFPPETPVKELEKELNRLRKKISGLGSVNLRAISEYEEHKTRFEFLSDQKNDLDAALDNLHKVIREINKISQEKFLHTFDEINRKMGDVFPRLFEGGNARLILTEPDKPLETGVELMIHPPGKKVTRLSLLSGGEKALSAIAFIFSIFLLKPASFCIMDEIDAPLDDANVSRFNELIKIIGEKSQIIMITHNKRSMEFADLLIGVTMEKKGISKLVSVNLT